MDMVRELVKEEKVLLDKNIGSRHVCRSDTCEKKKVENTIRHKGVTQWMGHSKFRMKAVL